MSQGNLQQVKQLADQLSFDEKLSLVEYLAQQLRQAETPTATAHSRKPRDLRGIWKGKFPENIDLDSLLHDIRHEWEKNGLRFLRSELLRHRHPHVVLVSSRLASLGRKCIERL